MTLIVAFLRENEAMLLGDALVSSKARPHFDNPIATISLPNENELIYDSGPYVVGSSRKIFPITEQLYIGISGNSNDLQAPVEKLRSICRPGVQTPEQLNDWYQTAGFNPKTTQTFLLGAAGKRFCLVTNNNDAVLVRDSSHLFVGGSGNNLFMDRFNNSFRLVEGDYSKPIGLIGPCIIARLIVSQYQGGFGLREGVGGFYELALGGIDKIEHFQGILYVFRHWWTDEDGLNSNHVKEVFTTDGVHSNIDAIYYTTYSEGSLIVVRWLPGAVYREIIDPPFLNLKTTWPSKLDKLDLVVETLMHPSRKVLFNTIENTNNYAVTGNELSIKVSIPNDLSSNMLKNINSILKE